MTLPLPLTNTKYCCVCSLPDALQSTPSRMLLMLYQYRSCLHLSLLHATSPTRPR
jgi:hypothetical protein